jgi:micrococcal nuclease
VLTASVLKIVDGDTIDVRLEGCTLRVRSIGVNTPETSHPMKGVEPFVKEAKEATRRLVEGQTVRLERDVEQYDQYGRLLVYVYVGDTMVNAELVRQGYTRVATFPPNVKDQELCLRRQREARKAMRGLWADEPRRMGRGSHGHTPGERPALRDPWRTAMFQKVLLAAALQHWDVPSPYAIAAREVAVQLAKGSSHPLYVLTVYSYPVLPLVRPPLVGPTMVEESRQILTAEEAALHADMETKLRDYVHAIEQAGVAVVPLIRTGSPREDVVRVAEEIGADCLVIGAHSKRSVFDLGGTAQAICQRVPAIVVMASPAQ